MTVTATTLSSNNLAIVYYEQTECDSKAMIHGVTKAVEYTSYATLALSVLPCKIVGL